MATVQDSTRTDVLAALQSTSTQAAKKEDAAVNADRFLKMLVAQLKNQDPLNPLDNAQVTSQMAQISTVEGINKLNSTLSSLIVSQNAGQSLQAASMVGHQVLAAGNTTLLAGGQAFGGYELKNNADHVVLTVKSAAGQTVYTQDLGPQGAGLHLFNWDGMTASGQQAAEGAYSFELSAKAGKDAVSVQALTLGRVDGVTPGPDGVKLNVGGLGEMSISDIKQIL